jgi:cytochrome c553
LRGLSFLARAVEFSGCRIGCRSPGAYASDSVPILLSVTLTAAVNRRPIDEQAQGGERRVRMSTCCIQGAFFRPFARPSDGIMPSLANMLFSLGLAAAIALAAAHGAAAQSSPSGGAEDMLFEQNCAGCHGNPATRAPARAALQAMSPNFIVEALANGSHESARGGPLGGVQWGVATNGKAVYAAVSDLAIVDLALGQPIVLDPNKGGGLHALAVATGDVLWSAPPAKACGERKNCSPAQSGAVTATPDFVLSGSVDGHIRAYAPADGRLLWDFDMVKPFETVNGVDARGGSLDSAGPTISGGMIFVNSGYGLYGGEPGNVLVAFAPRR